MMCRHLSTLLPALLLLAGAGQAHARGGCGGPYCYSAPYCQPAYCQPQYACSYVPKTVYVPQVTVEERQVTVTEYRREMVERTIQVPQMVTEQREVTYTVMRPDVRERTIVVHRCIPEQQQRNVQYTVLVPYQEQVQAVRRVCRPVPVEQTYHVTVDRGSYQTYVQRVPVRVRVPSHGCGHGCGYGGCGYGGCGGCYAGCGYGGCGYHYATTYVERPCRRWVPNLVQEERRVMVLKPTIEEVPYTYTVTRCRPEVRERTITVVVPRIVPEERTIHYTVMVPQQVTRTVPVQVCHMVPRQVSYPVMVPVPVQRTVPVRVCRYVPRTVHVRVCTPVYAHGRGYRGCGGGCYSGGC